jgi:hypothetical protein
MAGADAGAGWRVRNVVALVVGSDELDRRSLLTDVVQGRLRPARINIITPARYDTHTQSSYLRC